MIVHLQEKHRLHFNRQFQYVYRRGNRASTRDLSLLYVRNAQKRIGFSVSKKVGGAVERNRVKRLLREHFRQRMALLKPGFYVVVARPSAARQSYTQLSGAVDDLLLKMRLLEYGEEGSKS